MNRCWRLADALEQLPDQQREACARSCGAPLGWPTSKTFACASSTALGWA